MSSSDLPKLLRTPIKTVHRPYLCTGLKEVLNNFGRSDDNMIFSEKMLISTRCIHGFMPNSNKKSVLEAAQAYNFCYCQIIKISIDFKTQTISAYESESLFNFVSFLTLIWHTKV